ncbi:hypothetical protein C8R44DRAFT_197224 [Mycena epipterygia]|nr:hypothetical protein C8R44DRAFT_197224 [Mycena epipterygia]
MPEDVFLASPRKSPANRRSTASLRGPTSLAGALDGGDDAANGRFSLAHELAVAMMPEPSAGSKLLAEEFGIEFDEGAEGIDDPVGGPQITVSDSFADADPQLDASFDDGPPEPPDFGFGGDPTFGGDPAFGGDPSFGGAPVREEEARVEQDAMEVLAQDLASTDNFLAHLRRLDVDPSSSAASASSPSQQPALERLAADVIRRINDTARDREGQVRELLGYEREFRRIAGEVGGQDVLGQLSELPVPEDDDPAPPPPTASPTTATSAPPTRPARHARAMSQDWETDPDVDRLGDTDPAYDGRNDDDAAASPVTQTTFASAAPPAQGPAGQLAGLRGLTGELVAALTSVSEHAQVNGAATAEAGRKIRALRNRLGGWRAEWEGAERSRGRIERWEAGEAWGGDSTPTTTPVRGAKRVDGRAVVQEHLSAFERALADAAVKTKAIMAA